MLEIKNLFAYYGKKEVLHDVSLLCPSGTLTSLIGPNGCGKSTLLKSAAGILKSIKGDILFDSNSVFEMSQRKIAQKAAYLSQGKNIPDITAFGLVLHGRFPYLSYPRKYRREDLQIAKQAMTEMGIYDLANEKAENLSGGMRQKVYIASALCRKADIILPDEPMTYLDISHQFRLYEMFCNMAKEGKTILCVSHDIISALKFSDRIAVMYEGKILACDTPKEIMDSGIISEVFHIDVKKISNGEEDIFYYTHANN